MQHTQRIDRLPALHFPVKSMYPPEYVQSAQNTGCYIVHREGAVTMTNNMCMSSAVRARMFTIYENLYIYFVHITSSSRSHAIAICNVSVLPDYSCHHRVVEYTILSPPPPVRIVIFAEYCIF